MNHRPGGAEHFRLEWTSVNLTREAPCPLAGNVLLAAAKGAPPADVCLMPRALQDGLIRSRMRVTHSKEQIMCPSATVRTIIERYHRHRRLCKCQAGAVRALFHVASEFLE